MFSGCWFVCAYTHMQYFFSWVSGVLHKHHKAPCKLQSQSRWGEAHHLCVPSAQSEMAKELPGDILTRNHFFLISAHLINTRSLTPAHLTLWPHALYVVLPKRWLSLQRATSLRQSLSLTQAAFRSGRRRVGAGLKCGGKGNCSHTLDFLGEKAAFEGGSLARWPGCLWDSRGPQQKGARGSSAGQQLKLRYPLQSMSAKQKLIFKSILWKRRGKRKRVWRKAVGTSAWRAT